MRNDSARDPSGSRRGAAVARSEERVAARVASFRFVRAVLVCECHAVGTAACDTSSMRWMHRVRLYPTVRQQKCLGLMLDVTRQLYNALLQQRRDAWNSRRIAVTTKQQYRDLTELRQEDARVAAVYRECEDAVLHRLDLAMRAFFRRLGNGEVPGYPRFKAAERWKQLEFPHGDRALKLDATQRRVRIPGVGTIGLRKGREIPDFGRALVIEKNGRWYAVFECEREASPLPKTGKLVAIDRGVHVLAATSDGELIPNGRYGERHRRIVAAHARELASVTERDARGRCLNRRDPVRKAAARRLARAQERAANARLQALHETANTLVASADVLVLEHLALRAMTRSAKGTLGKPGRNVAAKRSLNRVLLDAGFGILARLIREKAAYAAREVVAVDSRYSSQSRWRCLHVAAKSRRKRRFLCVGCGWSCHADVAAALELRRRAELRPTSAPSRARTPLALHDAA
jgi:putative transposase